MYRKTMESETTIGAQLPYYAHRYINVPFEFSPLNVSFQLSSLILLDVFTSRVPKACISLGSSLAKVHLH